MGSRHYWSFISSGDHWLPQGVGSSGTCRTSAGIVGQTDLEMVIRWCLLGIVGLQAMFMGSCKLHGARETWKTPVPSRVHHFSGWCSMADAGRQRGENATAYKTSMVTSCVCSLLGRWTTSWLPACSVGKFGTRCFRCSGCSSLPRTWSSPSVSGGCRQESEFLKFAEEVSTPLSS